MLLYYISLQFVPLVTLMYIKKVNIAVPRNSKNLSSQTILDRMKLAMEVYWVSAHFAAWEAIPYLVPMAHVFAILIALLVMVKEILKFNMDRHSLHICSVIKRNKQFIRFFYPCFPSPMFAILTAPLSMEHEIFKHQG